MGKRGSVIFESYIALIMKYQLLNLLFAFALLIPTACQSQQEIPTLSEKEHYRMQGYQNLPAKSQLQLASDQEPGERLVICGKMIDRATRQPLKNQRVLFYQTNKDGDYERTDPNDATSARLRGTLQTNDLGMFYLDTILPGDYGSGGNRHIHTEVENAQPKFYDLFFKPYSSSRVLQFVEDGDQQFLVDLRRQSDGTLVGFVTMEIKR